MKIAAIENCNIKTFNCPNPTVKIEQQLVTKASKKRHLRNIGQAILGQLPPEPSLKKDKRRNPKSQTRCYNFTVDAPILFYQFGSA